MRTLRKKSKPHRKQVFAAAAALTALLLFSVTVTVYAVSSRTVLILDDGAQTSLTTTKSDVYDILRIANVTIGNDDYIDLTNYASEGDCVIRIYRAKRVWLVDENGPRQMTGAGWVGRLLEQQGVTLGERDKLSHDPNERLEAGMEVVVSRAFDVALRDYGREYSLTLTEGTVAHALALCGLALEGEDFVEPGLTQALAPGVTIKISRVAWKERRATLAIDFERETKKSGTMDLGMEKIEQKGEKGEKETVFSDKYINGARVDSVVLSETILRQPVKEIKTIGTRVQRLAAGATPISTLTPPDTLEIVDGVPTRYLASYTGVAKAYHGDPGVASGLGKPVPGYVAVDPKQFPYGTKLWIVSNDGRYVYGYSIAADTGGFVAMNACMIDLYMPSEAMCEQWGARGVTVYVLDEPRMQTPYGG
ncbi:MAG: ubiquitin-like domain-containing protein [Oscillospiraceae bacterium]|nr:ubiquitin-like domain-containing protein [Oscillospiraceae bacterium]